MIQCYCGLYGPEAQELSAQSLKGYLVWRSQNALPHEFEVLPLPSVENINNMMKKADEFVKEYNDNGIHDIRHHLYQFISETQPED